MKVFILAIFMAFVGAVELKADVIQLTEGGFIQLGNTTVTCSALSQQASRNAYLEYTCDRWGMLTLSTRSVASNMVFSENFDFHREEACDQAKELLATAPAEFTGGNIVATCYKSVSSYLKKYRITPDSKPVLVSSTEHTDYESCAVAARAVNRNIRR